MNTRHSPGGKALTELILEVFRVNGRLLSAGDRLVEGLGLTSARWQVLGAIAFAESRQPVSWLARSMGLNRQGVQRIVNELRREGLVELEPNPHHRRAHLVVLSKRGRTTFDAAARLQIPWSNALASAIPAADIDAATRALAMLQDRLSSSKPEESAQTNEKVKPSRRPPIPNAR